MKGVALERLSREELKKLVREMWLENLALRQQLERAQSLREAQGAAQR